VARARMSRSELKAQDEISSTLQGFGETALARKNELLTAGAIVLVLVLAFFGWRYYSRSQDAVAQRELGAAIAAFRNPAAKSDSERFEKTIVEAQKALTNNPSARTAPVARYYLGLAKDGLGDKEGAVKDLEEAISRADAETKPIVQFALAVGIYKRHGDFQKAIDVLKQVEQSGGYSKSAVQYEIGSASEGASLKDQAQAYYGKVITESPDSPFRGDAEAALKRLGFPVPTPAPTPAPAAPAAK
jgi:tetratricopeptide (TPR) repeat protein